MIRLIKIPPLGCHFRGNRFDARDRMCGRVVVCFFLGVAGFIMMGCETLSLMHPLPDRPPLVQKSVCPYFMAPLDQVQIISSGRVQKTLQVSQSGMLDIQGSSRKVKGMPANQLRQILRAAYPGASTFKIEEFRPNRVTVLGEVFHQIYTQLGDGPMRVMDAIAAANGFTPLANKRRVRLLRQNADRIEIYELNLRMMLKGADLEQNLLLQSGDVITVPRNFL